MRGRFSRKDVSGGTVARGQAVRECAASVAHAVGNPHRLRLLVALAQCPKSVERLANEAELSIANTSAHLKVLQAAALIRATRVGRQVINEITDDSVFEFLVSLRRVVERQTAEGREAVNQWFDRPWDDAAPAGASAKQLRQVVGEPGTYLVDVRQPDEFAYGHLPGAENLPAEQLGTHVRRLRQKSERVAAYCRGPYCAVAAAAVRQLRAAGVNAHHFPIGVIEWRAAGLQTETGSRTGAN